MDLSKKILNLDEGLTIYSHLLKDEEAILIPFAISQYVTVSRISELLTEYQADLKRNECKESLSIVFNQMTSVDYWMQKLVKLRSDMEMLATVPMKEHGFVVTIVGFCPETTMDLYRAIERLIIEMVEMLTEVRRSIQAAPHSLYANFYLSQKAACDCRPLEASYAQWRRDIGVPNAELLKDKEVQEVVAFLKKKVFRFIKTPSTREVGLVDLDSLNEFMPKDNKFPDEFPKCYARFLRYAKVEDGIYHINYNTYGKYLYDFYYQLSDDERQALIEFDIMLDLIHQEMAAQNQDDDIDIPGLPDALNNPKAKKLLMKARKAGYLDDRFQPKLSNALSALLANQIAVKLDIDNKWKVFEAFWGRHDMYKDYHRALTQKQCSDFLKTLYSLYG